MDSMYDPIPTEGDEAPTKKVRHRKKQFLQTIRKQMEFYFSDANLSKNRFLGQLVAEDPEVDLSRFLQFNKIRELTNDPKDIRKALKKSELLALTEDGTKVFRKTAVRLNNQTDESTIYVERLPPDADHEWLRNVFLSYGDVPYVSIPKYPHNGLNKGFAFVEFDSPESATRALEAFGAMGCRLTAEIPPDQICSNTQGMIGHRNEVPVGMDPNFKVPAEKNVRKKSRNKTKKLKSDVVEDYPEDQDGGIKSKQPERKRKVLYDDDQEAEAGSVLPITEEWKVKRMKVKQDSGTEGTESNTDGLEGPKQEHKRTEDQAQAEPEKARDDKCDVKSPEIEVKASKKRKHQKSQEEELESAQQNSVEEADAKYSKKRRKEKEEEPEAGQSATETASKDAKDDEKENEGNEESRKKKKSRHHKKKNKKERLDPEPNMNLRVLSKFEWKRLRNKYLDLQKVRMTQLKQHLHRSRWGSGSQDHNTNRQRQEGSADEKPKKTEKKFTFTPGVIVHLKFPEPLGDAKKFKTDAKTNPDVKYVDAKEGWEEAYIRCTTAEAANGMVAQHLWSHMDVLTGAEEASYWEKMNRDREVKCGRNERVKVRGKAKLLAKVEKAVGKHIRFTTEEEITPKG